MFVAIEGLDGAGTTTQTALLAAALRDLGHTVLETREPSDGPVGVLTRQALKRRVVTRAGTRLDPAAIALIFAADRIDHLRDEVEPALAEGSIVLTDRYVHSSVAYQGSECDVDWVLSINSQARTADLVVFVDVPVDECLRRIDARGDRDLFEKREFLEKVAAGYETAFSRRGAPVVRVDGTLPIDQVHTAILGALRQRLGIADR
jgi:dTMP kinase